MKKHILLTFIVCLLAQFAMAQSTNSHFEVLHQNTKEKQAKPRVSKKSKKLAQDKIDKEKYWIGKVPVANGIVTFEKTFPTKGKSQQQVYDAMHQFVQQLIDQATDKEKSFIGTEDAQTGTIIASVGETMYFKRSKWETDYTSFYYQLTVNCENDQCKVILNNIQYRYEEQRDIPGAYLKAEEWITDDQAFNKKKTEFLRETAKFRRGTIDRVEAILSLAGSALE